MKEIDELEMLIEFKKKSGFNYGKIARELGVHRQTVVGWFIGKSKPSPLAKEKIEQFLMIKSRA